MKDIWNIESSQRHKAYFDRTHCYSRLFDLFARIRNEWQSLQECYLKTVIALFAGIFVAGCDLAMAEGIITGTLTTHECTPQFSDLTAYKKLTMKRVLFESSNEASVGIAELTIDGFEGIGTYKTHGLTQLFGSIINGVNYVVLLEGSEATLIEIGSPHIEIETGEPEYIRRIGTFVCEETERMTETKHEPREIE